MSHELRTPMHAITGFSGLGEKKSLKNNMDDLASYFKNINNSAKRLTNLLNDLLDLSSLQSGIEKIDIKANNLLKIVEKSLTEIAPLIESKNIEIRKDLKDINIFCDREKITQVIINLMSNAIKFTPEGKNITISMKSHTINNKKGILLTVADEGIGIPEEEIKTIFNEFVQSSKTKTGAGGTGLGLAICKNIIEHHGGEIWAENIIKRNKVAGAAFHITLPAKQ